MKKMIFNFILIITTFLFIGCGQPKPKLTITEKKYDTGEYLIFAQGTTSYDTSETTEIHNFAIFLKKASKKLKKSEIKYFTLNIINRDETHKRIPEMLNTFESLVKYCYPKNNGYKIDNYSSGDSTLENKCKLSEYEDNPYINIVLSNTKKSLHNFIWSTAQISTDKYIDKYVEEVNKNIK